MQKFNPYFFTKYINISDILERSEDEQYAELEEFYNMTNREFFEKYGVNVIEGHDKILLANAVLIDSLLKDKYDEVDTIWCGCIDNNHYKITIHLKDGTVIIAGDTDKFKGITIEKNGKKVKLNYDPISRKGLEHINDINDLSIENITYVGDDIELTEQLRNAVNEQFGIGEREKLTTEQDKKEGTQESVHSSIDMTDEEMLFLKRQIIVKKFQLVLDGLKNGDNREQTVEDIEEFEILQELLWMQLYGTGSIGHASVGNDVEIPGLPWHKTAPAKQYEFIQLPEGKRLFAEFSARENKGRIRIKDFDKMIEPEDGSDFEITSRAIDEQVLMGNFDEYITDESLRQLMERKLHAQNKQLSSLEIEEKTIAEAESLIDQQKAGQDIGEE